MAFPYIRCMRMYSGTAFASMHDDLDFYSNALSIHILGSIIELLSESLLNFQLGLRLSSALIHPVRRGTYLCSFDTPDE